VAEYGYLDILKYLIKKGASVKKEDVWGRNALSQAIHSDNTNIIEYLEIIKSN
jgi:ankyrin repeat protein